MFSINTFPLRTITLLIVFTSFLNVRTVTGQCASDAACNEVCGVQGNGTCVPKKSILGVNLGGKYCSCDGCPTRSLEELLKPHVCTLDPICQLNCNLLDWGNGRSYWGHSCLSWKQPSLVCVCFCLPITIQSVIDTLTCPFRSQQQPKPLSIY